METRLRWWGERSGQPGCGVLLRVEHPGLAAGVSGDVNVSFVLSIWVSVGTINWNANFRWVWGCQVAGKA